MRTVIAGLAVLRRAPFAVAPIAVESVVVSVLIVVGLLPASGASAPAAAVFPLDLFFDIKQSLAATTGWFSFVVVIVLAIVVRAGVLVTTLWLAEGRPGSVVPGLMRGIRVAALAAVSLLPSAIFLFAGTAIRYAPFIWIGALLGFVPAFSFARAALRLDVGRGPVTGRGIPEAMGFLAYTYLVAVTGAAMSILSGVSSVAAAAIPVFIGPLHALFLLGWRQHLRNGTFPGGGLLSAAVTVIIFIVLVSATFYDRVVREAPPVGRVANEGRLFLLGGVDSTVTEGALADLDPRQVGFANENTETLSYRAGGPHTKTDTRGDLIAAAQVVATQLSGAPDPRLLLGHSQAGLIVDRILDRGLATPDRSVILAAPPPFPPRLEAPAPGESGAGAPGADASRALAWLLDTAGMESFDIDAPASPIRLQPVAVIDSRVPRLAVWPLGDSVWLDRDWRRPGETNVVAITDHVGVTNNARALAAARSFYRGGQVPQDESSWRGALVAVLRYAFEPWRPMSKDPY
ncbi:MAG: hypothetical protein ACRDKT_07855 [Actinomycetota bacterium]